MEVTTWKVTYTVGGIPNFQISVRSDPSGTDLANFNSSQALLNVSTSNVAITSTSGSVGVTVSNASTGQLLGQQTFGYVVQGDSLYAQDPTALHNWLSQFGSYSDVYVDEQVSDLMGEDTATSGTASATAHAEYQGTTYASAYKSWPIPSGPCSYPRKCYQN